MTDGANLGITARRALGSILGSEDQPTDEERTTSEETRARLEAAPLFEGPKPWDGDKDSAYSMATDSIGHAFLILIEEDPSLLEPRLYPDTYPNGEPMDEWLKGKTMDPDSMLWQAMKERWPHADDWVGGASGFMVGFALNSALFASGRGPIANPAIIEIGGKS